MHGARFRGHDQAGGGDQAADAGLSLNAEEQIPQPGTGGTPRHNLWLWLWLGRVVFRPKVALMAYCSTHTSLLIYHQPLSFQITKVGRRRDEGQIPKVTPEVIACRLDR